MSATATGTAKRAASSAMKPSVNGIGLQLYTVADQLRTDFEGTIEKVAQIGYQQVEFAGYSNKTPEQVRALLDRHKLKSPSTHIGMVLCIAPRFRCASAHCPNCRARIHHNPITRPHRNTHEHRRRVETYCRRMQHDGCENQEPRIKTRVSQPLG